MKKVYLSLLLLCLSLLPIAIQAQFVSSGAGSFTYTIPSGCFFVAVDANGAQGGNGCDYSGYPGGLGGRVQCQMAVTPGQILYITVGGVGGYNAGGSPGGGNGSSYGGGGGGYTAIKNTSAAMSGSNALVVAGAGGGGDCYYGDGGGAGGGLVGGNGLWGCTGTCGSYDSYNNGAGGSTTTSTGGSGASGGGNPGGFGFGGNAYCCYYGGAGGGGYYGGGGGYAGSGGGGSSYTNSTYCTAITHTKGVQSGNGFVRITPLLPTVVAAPTTIAFGNVTAVTTSVPPQFFSISGSILTSGSSITLTPPTNFALSMDGVTWGANGTAITYTYSGTSFNNVNVYVRFNPTATTSYSGNIAITGGGLASAVNVAVTGTGSAACSGTPTAGTASVSPAAGSVATMFTLSLSGVSAAGNLFYQWQSGTSSGGPFTNINGAITPTYSFVGISASTFYRCVVTCGTGASATSTVVNATNTPSIASSSCTVPNASGGVCCGFYVANATYPFSVTGEGGSTLNDNSNLSGANYVDKSGTLSVVFRPGASYTTNIAGGSSNQMSQQMWIDFSGNGTFETSETVGGTSWNSGSGVQHPVITIPAGVPQGAYRMRVMVDYNCCGAPYYPSYPSLPPCPSSSGTTQPYYFEVRDYKVIIGVPSCSGTPSAGITSSAPSSSCSTFSPFLYNTGETIAATGITYQWQSSTTSPTSGFSNISGATGQGFVPTISAVGPVYYRQTVTCGASTATSIVTSDTLYTQPTAITGTLTVCSGTTTTLSSTPSGGTWSSGSANATVNSTTGVVTGVNGGTTANITYTTAGGCFVTTTVTVNVQPAPIFGTFVLCPAATATFTDATSGGTWSSSNTSLATVGSASGFVTAIAGGNPVISYTAPTGCSSVATVTVQALAPITGINSMCNGFTTNLFDATPSGVWSSSNTSVATVNSSGVVSGLSVGSTTISYTVASLGCTATLPAFVTNAPSAFTVTGGGSFCFGGSGVTVGVGSSNSGISYQLFNGATPVGSPITAAGFPFSFPAQTAAGTYFVVANPGTACALSGTGSATIVVNPLPTPFTVSGGGAYCTGSSGVHIFLNSSQIGVNYQLFVNTGGGPTPVGSVVPGTSASLDFGFVTTVGTYTVGALNTVTGCAGNMANSVSVSINALPTSTFTVTGGGGYCTGGTGLAVGLSNSTTGVSYQLFLAGSPVGTPVNGVTGSAITFPPQTVAGVYTIVGTNTSTGCQATMTGASTITINSLPSVFTVTGGGPYCFGTTIGVPIGVSNSQSGVNYQLYRGSTLVGTVVAGTGSAIAFPNQTTVGAYTVVATNPTTGCISSMFGSANVSTNPLPIAFTLTAPFGNSYCVGGTGVRLILSSSETGATYQLINGSTPVGPIFAGTGAPIDFGLITGAGNYTARATYTATGCVGTMAGSVTVVVNPLPTAYNVTVTGGGTYCASGTGPTVGLSLSQTGVSYQLYLAGVPVTPAVIVAGTGAAISFGARTVPGAYTVVATNTTTLCTNNMTGSAAVIVNPLPVAYTMTGGGGYCAGSSGVRIGLSGSDVGVNYQLKNGGASVGSPLAGIGAAIDFGLITTAGASYTVVATNTTTGCTNTMTGTLPVSINPLPVAYSVTGTGNYCAGGSGMPVGVSNSTTGVNYQAYLGITPVGAAVAGSTGSAITLGSMTTAGTYTILGTDAVTGCSNAMSGSAVVGINPLPSVFTVTGGGGYCAGSAGAMVGLTGSVSGTDYQLYLGGVATGTPVAGTGTALSFGPQSGAGVYTVIGTTTATSCSNNMAGSVTVIVNALPTLYAVTGGGNYCSGGTGVHVGLSSSSTGISYQLMLGASPVGAPMPGTGGTLDFGTVTTGGSYTVMATNTTTGCSVSMTGSANVVVSPLPTAYTVNGGGNYCPGTSGIAVGLSGSDAAVTYQLYRAGSPVGAPVTGTGAAISFGLQTSLGNYTVVATNPATTCTANMTGSVNIGTYTLPIIFNVTGGGNYCPGGNGVNVGVSGSSLGVNYQLYRNGIATGTPLAGTGSALSFGLRTLLGTYTIVATNTTTGCTIAMNGNAIVGLYPLPVVHNVTGGGNYCVGGTGRHIGLDGSDVGNYYQLMNGITPVGTPMVGTGASLDFGLQTATGTYTIVGTGSASTCNNTMTGSVMINLDPLPNAYAVTGGGNYCLGGTGVDVSISNSDLGINYQLYNGTTMVGPAMPGTGAGFSFGLQTGAGSYNVVATNSITGCTSNMTGGASVVINPLPTAFNVTGGGNYCTGGSGVHVTTSGSDVGTQYQLMIGGVNTGAPIAGTGFGLDFGLQTATGVYTVAANNTYTGCTGNMSGSVTVGVNPLPFVYTLSGAGSSYCAGGSGILVSLSGSDLGVNYQLYNGGIAVGGPMAGTGLSLSYGYITATGTYTVKAVDAVTGCSTNMTGSATIVINPLPVAFAVIGGGSYCNGGTGVNVGLGGSNVGVQYQLYLGGIAVGGSLTGTGGPLNFGLQTTAGTYTIIGTNTTTGCSNTMTGSVSVVVNPLPSLYTVTGGGNYCAGGSGVAVGLSGSALGINYQLWKAGVVMASMPGTGLPISFGTFTATGNYTVTGTNTATSCVRTMSGSATVGTNPLPTVFTVTGGGNYCIGGTGVAVGLSGSNTGVSYQLFNGTTMVGGAVPGTGSSISFGMQTASGSYTVMATNTTTGCNNTMSGSVNVVINSLPNAYAVIGGGNYCAGGSGVHIGLNNSASGVSYQLYNGATPAGSPVIGTGSPIDFGLQTAAGTYTAIATDGSTSCSSNMIGSVSVGINPLVSPAVTISTGVGTNICSGEVITFTAMAVNGGGGPSYQWTVNGSPTGIGSTYTYAPANGDVVAVTMTSSAACATPSTASNSIAMTVNNSEMPGITVTANPGTSICQGTIVNYTATATFGGSAPTYAWILNGVNSGSASTFSYTPANGDEIYCVVTSNYHCRLANTATSTHMNMEVALPIAPTVTITANPGTNIAPGETVVLTATASGAGVSPSMQWYVNGSAVTGANLPTFASSNFANGDSVSCEVTTTSGCIGLTGADHKVFTVRGVGVQQITSGNSDVQLVPNPNKGIFNVKGSLGTSVDQEVSFEVTNMLGQVIYTNKMMAHNGEINATIKLSSNLANGMYMLNMRSDADNKVFHIVIEQ